MHSTKRDVDTFIQKFENSRISSLTFKLICLICHLKIQFLTFIAMCYIADQFQINAVVLSHQISSCILVFSILAVTSQHPRTVLTASSQHPCGILAASSQRPRSVLAASLQRPCSVQNNISAVFVYSMSSQHPRNVLVVSLQLTCNQNRRGLF